MKALIIVDVQNDFMPQGSLPVPGGNEIVPVINQIQEHFELVVATQDWHPDDHLSFASNHKGKKAFDVIDLNGLQQTLWPDHCVQCSQGADFHPELDTRRIEAVIRKGMDREVDSYSGFYDNGRIRKTGLAGYLKEKECREIYFCGLAADICVYYTIKDALKEGFSSKLILDATSPLDENNFIKIMEELLHTGVELITSNDINF